jgi:hypothetical protein
VNCPPLTAAVTVPATVVGALTTVAEEITTLPTASPTTE